jgi:hypothetical protein
MSKYSKLIGLAREILPSGERVLVNEGDDFLRALRELDERHIESEVSKMDAFNRANQIKKDLKNRMYPREEFSSLVERRPKTRELSSKLDAFKYPDLESTLDSPRNVGSLYFPKEFDDYVDLDEIAQLSKQYGDNFSEQLNIARNKNELRNKLSKLNPDVNYGDIYDVLNDARMFGDEYDIAKERFNKIRGALKDKERK